jgi:hypothetical protein
MNLRRALLALGFVFEVVLLLVVLEHTAYASIRQGSDLMVAQIGRILAGCLIYSCRRTIRYRAHSEG